MLTVVAAWKIHTNVVVFLPSRTSTPRAANVIVPGEVQYTPGYNTSPDRSEVEYSVVQTAADAAPYATAKSRVHCAVEAVEGL